MHHNSQLSAPDFSKVTDRNELMFQVLKEMQQTNFLDCYYERYDRISLIINLWNKRSLEINNA